ncbi:PEP-CTERM sorting domain-containing protein [Pseudanabaenaceae cyanobacterium LEGE 13415]|nr:PEP-CTERM sorting domain-containing protein [Pseudanabaenaceae cyanobacterium LEGE 13415]
MLKASLIAGISLTIATLPVSAQVLYSGSRNTSFSTQGWTSVIPAGTESIFGGGTTLNTTRANDLRAGYSIFRPLNRSQGYTLSFDLQLLAESHISLNRAGFSIIALSSDRRGIELGFWKNDPIVRDRIWAQNDGATRATRFTRGEGTPFDPSRRIVRYELSVKDNRYGLFADRTLVLSGNLRNYSIEGTPYNLPNFVFLGDNTTSAQGSVRITRVALSNTAIPFASSTARMASASVTSVPEPITIVGTGFAVALGRLFAKKRPSRDRK